MVKTKHIKNILYLLLLLLLPVGNVAQQPSVKGTITEKETTFNNLISCDLELLLSANFSYQKRITNKVFVGGMLGFGFPIGLPWNNREDLSNRSVIGESFNVGVLLNYKISERWRYEFSPLYTIFSTTNGTDGFTLVDGPSGFGIKNAIFFTLKKVQLGISASASYLNIGYREQSNKITYFRKLTWYNSFIKLRVPIKNW